LDSPTCETLVCIAKFTGENRDVITPILTAIAGFVGGWRLHVIKVNRETRCAHFNDLKENVISPILDHLTVKPYAFPSIEEAQNQAILYTLPSRGVLQLDPIENKPYGREFDPVLLIDFIHNHYPEVATFWNDFCKCNSEVLKKGNNAEEMITRKLQDLLRRDDYKIADDPHKHSQIKKDEFKSQIMDLIITNELGCSTIDEDPSQPGRIQFNLRTIYMLNKEDDKNKVLANLRTLCSSITLDGSIIEELRGDGGYNKLLENRNKSLREFITKINTIQRQTNLKIMRKRSGRIKCQLI
jgi:hypothetical protein